jgi:hypothetical protein
MNYSLIARLIFQNLLRQNVTQINSTPELKMYIIGFLVEGSYAYTENDIDPLSQELMKFLTVDEVNEVQYDQQVSTISSNEITEDQMKEFVEQASVHIDALEVLINDIKDEDFSQLSYNIVTEFDNIVAELEYIIESISELKEELDM